MASNRARYICDDAAKRSAIIYDPSTGERRPWVLRAPSSAERTELEALIRDAWPRLTDEEVARAADGVAADPKVVTRG